MTVEGLTVRDDEENHRYVAEVDGELAALTVYHLRRGPRYFFVHTEVMPGYSGRGIAEKLVREALDDVRAKQGHIVPLCPYVNSFVNKHPEYDDLVDHEIFDRIANRLHTD